MRQPPYRGDPGPEADFTIGIRDRTSSVPLNLATYPFCDIGLDRDRREAIAPAVIGRNTRVGDYAPAELGQTVLQRAQGADNVAVATRRLKSGPSGQLATKLANPSSTSFG